MVARTIQARAIQGRVIQGKPITGGSIGDDTGIITRYLTNFTGGSATTTDMTTDAGDYFVFTASASTDFAGEVITGVTRAVGGALTGSSGSLSPSSMPDDGVVNEYTWSSITAGTTVNTIASAAYRGIFKYLQWYSSGGALKAFWDLGANTGYFIDKANPIADIYVDENNVLADWNNGDFVAGVDSVNKSLTWFNTGKYYLLVSSAWNGVVSEAGGITADLLQQGASGSTVDYSNLSGTEQDWIDAVEFPNVSRLDFNGGSFTDQTMAELRQAASDPVGVITGSVEYIEVQQVSGAWLGTNELVTNGTFDVDLSGWTFTDPPWRWNNGKAEDYSSVDLGDLEQQLPTFTGVQHKIEFDASDLSGGTPLLRQDGTVIVSVTANGHYDTNFTAATNDTNIRYSGFAALWMLDNVTCKAYVEDTSL